MTEQELKACLPFASEANIKKFLIPLNNTFLQFEINNSKRQAAFLAQIAHESGSLRYVEEIASGEAYEGRKDLGNIQPGDGVRFKGRGLIQITGRANYKQLSKDLNYDFVSKPEDLELPGAAAMSAGWFWNKKKLNGYADQANFKMITKLINGGYNGLEDRVKHWHRCLKALGVKEINLI